MFATFFRDDTMFGICQALGEDLGFSPNLLRMLLGVGLLFAPAAAIAAYAVAALLVFVSRWLVPDPAGPCRDSREAEPVDLRQDVEELALAA